MSFTGNNLAMKWSYVHWLDELSNSTVFLGLNFIFSNINFHQGKIIENEITFRINTEYSNWINNLNVENWVEQGHKSILNKHKG